MAMGTRKQREKQEDLWIAPAELASAPGHPFYQRLNELLEAEGFEEFVEGRCAKVLCGEVRTPVTDAGDLLSGAADRVLRGHRGGARDCLAPGGFAGAAALCGHGAGRVHARSLDDLTPAAADRSGQASRSIRLGAGGAGGSRTAERSADRDRCEDAGGERGAAICADRKTF